MHLIKISLSCVAMLSVQGITTLIRDDKLCEEVWSIFNSKPILISSLGS